MTGSIDKISTGWRARWRDPEGKSRSKRFEKKNDAEKHLTSVRHSLLSGSYVDASAGKISFQTYAEEWRSRQVWRDSTDLAMRYALGRAYRVFGERSMASI